MSLRDLIKPLVPEPIVSLRRMRRARAEHDRVYPNCVAVAQERLDSCVLLANRQLMLDRLPKGGVAAEIGVAMGDYSQEVLDRTAPAKLHLIDPWDAPDPRYSTIAFENVSGRFADRIASGQVVLHRGYSVPVLETFADNSLDWVYVDGAHDYENVLADLRACQRVVKPGGIIAGHDYLRWSSPTYVMGVIEAVNQFVAETGSDFVFMTQEIDRHDSYALRLRK